MAGWITRRAVRRDQVRQQRARSTMSWRMRFGQRLLSRTLITSALFVIAAGAVALLGEATLSYSIGQSIEYPVYARADFRVLDDAKTEVNREAARARTPSYYLSNAEAVSSDIIRANLMRVFQAALDADTYEGFAQTLKDLNWPCDEDGYNRLRSMGDDAGRERFQQWVDALPLEDEYIVRDRSREPRTPASATGFIRLERKENDDDGKTVDIAIAELVAFGNERARHRSAAAVASRFPLYSLKPTVEAIVFAAFSEQPTIVFDRERTLTAMKDAEDSTQTAYVTFEKDQVIVKPGLLGLTEYRLLQAEYDAYDAFLTSGSPESVGARRMWVLQRAGRVLIAAILAAALLIYTNLHQRRILDNLFRTTAFLVLVLSTVVAARLLDLRWPSIPELVLAPCLVAGGVLAIVYPQRFAIGAMGFVSLLVCTLVHSDLAFLFTLLIGASVLIYLLDEIRTRTQLLSAGVITACMIVTTTMAGGLWEGHTIRHVVEHAIWASACALSASFVVSGILPLIERFFRIATALSLLEWRDPTRPLLQRLAREAPGTYNHSLVLGTLSEAACDSIGANGLLAQVGALYHDVGKIPKADYFVENQEGRISRHDNLAPTMSLLIILGHVKDGVEMAKEYKLPRVLHQFIEEHHGTTVVRYFHHMASEKQPKIASGKHDREVPETEFRYGGPKPTSRESAILMLCDGVEGAVRALNDPTPSRIESVVDHIVSDRLADGQLDDCDITLRQIRKVADSLVKSLCSIYHGRVAYPKATKKTDTEPPSSEGPATGTNGQRDARAG